MRTTDMLLWASLTVGSIALFGCETTGTEGPTTQPSKMSNVSDGSTDAPDITPEMKRFDAGIGDTGTHRGGGQE